MTMDPATMLPTAEFVEHVTHLVAQRRMVHFLLCGGAHLPGVARGSSGSTMSAARTGSSRVMAVAAS